MHDHDIAFPTELHRRELLGKAALAVGAGLLLGPLSARSAWALPVAKLPGFTAFASTVRIFKSSKYYLVESSGLPAHGMMTGITSWQQQVPTPHPYTGANAWSIPIKPVLSKTPMSAKNHFLRGAIAIAVNGVPIFNALNNRGDDALLAGELDDWGGHCGRADDYHYHVAPTHLQSIVGRGAPIAYALDGFPIYGLTETNGAKVVGLDEFNGHFDSKRKYHYHATNSYPYINGGFRGVVTEIDGQVDPQAATRPFRPAGAPLRGATITDFERTGDGAYTLRYTLNGQTYTLSYIATLSEVQMQFIDPSGQSRTEIYRRSS